MRTGHRLAVALVGVVALVAPASFAGARPAAPTGAGRPTTASGDPRDRLRRLAPGLATGLTGTATRTRSIGSTAVSAAPGRVAEADPPGDGRAPADIGAVAATMDNGVLRLGLYAGSLDPYTDPGWQVGDSYAGWVVDTTGDGNPDFDVFVIMANGGAYGAVTTADGVHFSCNANAGFYVQPRVFSATVPLACLGNPASVRLAGQVRYDATPGDGKLGTWFDNAPDSGLIEVTAAAHPARLNGGYVQLWNGSSIGFTADGRYPPSIRTHPSFNQDWLRNATASPDGGHIYTVDGFGDVFVSGLNYNVTGARPIGTPDFGDWDIARGIGILPSGRAGLVADGFGGLHPFGLGERRAAPTILGAPYWPGWDIVRGVAVLPNGRGGFVLDGFGGLHWFSIGRARPAPTIVGAPYWAGTDQARGIAIDPDGTAGVISDRLGGMHRFGIGGAPTTSVSGLYGFDSRGVSLLTRQPDFPPAPPTPMTSLSGGTAQDVEVDPSGTVAYVSDPTLDEVDVVSVATHEILTHIAVGPSPTGLDLSPDGSRLYVATKWNVIEIIDVASRTTVDSIPVPSVDGDWPYWVAAGPGGDLMVTTTFAGTGSGGRILHVDGTTQSVTFLDVTSERTRVYSSGDHTRALVVTADATGGPARLYDAETHQLLAFADADNFGFLEYGALDGDGSVVLTAPGVAVYDGAMKRTGTLPSAPGGVALDASGRYAFVLGQYFVRVYDLTTGALIAKIPTWADARPVYGSGGNLAVSSDGSVVAVATRAGVTVMATGL